MKKIFITLALVLGAYTAQAWNWVYDQAALLLAFENMTPEAQSVMKQYLGDNMGVAKLPTYTIYKRTANEKQNQLVSFAGYKLMGVSNYSKNKAEAMKFAQFYTSEEMQLLHYEYRGFVPTNTNAKASETLKGDACAAAITAQLAFSKPQKSVPSTLWTPMQGVGDSMISKATNSEEYTIAELVELITNAVSQIETVAGATA